MADDLNAAILQPFNIIKIVTGSVKRILLPRHDVLFKHMNVKDDISTASAATDFITIMHAKKQDGTDETMVATRAEGEKLVLAAGESGVLRGDDIRTGSNGDREVQIQATGNSAMVQVLSARNFLI